MLEYELAIPALMLIIVLFIALTVLGLNFLFPSTKKRSR